LIVGQWVRGLFQLFFFELFKFKRKIGDILNFIIYNSFIIIFYIK
jgi:hypothetical protein